MEKKVFIDFKKFWDWEKGILYLFSCGGGSGAGSLPGRREFMQRILLLLHNLCAGMEKEDEKS